MEPIFAEPQEEKKGLVHILEIFWSIILFVKLNCQANFWFLCFRLHCGKMMQKCWCIRYHYEWASGIPEAFFGSLYQWDHIDLPSLPPLLASETHPQNLLCLHLPGRQNIDLLPSPVPPLCRSTYVQVFKGCTQQCFLLLHHSLIIPASHSHCVCQLLQCVVFPVMCMSPFLQVPSAELDFHQFYRLANWATPVEYSSVNLNSRLGRRNVKLEKVVKE